MDKPLPSVFFPQFTVERMALISGWLLDELYATDDDLARDTDNPYTRGCTTFMRQRNRILKEAVSGRHPWLTVNNHGNDLVFSIDGVPCRYSNDDPDNPTKDAVITAGRYQESFLDFDDTSRPSRFCFVVDRGIEGFSDPHVEFLGFTAHGSLACRWVSSSVRTLHAVNTPVPVAAVPVEKPQLAPKRRDTDTGGNTAEQS